MMATLLLSAAGAAIGGSFGGSVAGLTSLALGKAIGATVGSVIDQRLMGLGSAPVESGRVDRFRVMGSGEGAALPRVFGRARVPGQIIWSSRFLESVNRRRVGGKGVGGGATVREFSYSISLAVAICEGEVTRIGRIWADGQAVEQAGLAWRLHPGTEDQLPDPLIAAIESSETAPAYRGTAYVVFENFDLTPYGNRIPQFNFEVFRRPAWFEGMPRPPAMDVRGIALVPGTGEYALATEPVVLERGKGEGVVLNVHNDQGEPDLIASMAQLTAELPNTRSVSLVVSWFGDDLRCDRCRLRPAVEQDLDDASSLPWQVSGQARSGARIVSQLDGRPLFGGTPADATVEQAIRHLKAIGQEVMFYPFILMDILANNRREDPWTGESDQPAIPWRGRITLSRAPGRPGSPDRTTAAASEVEAFFGTARPSDFEIVKGVVRYTGPAEWTYRRFVLHYAHLCMLAGGVDAFCIGSEMRGLTQIRDSALSYPAVQALRSLADDVRAVMGPDTRIGYAADWSEYFGHQPSDATGDVLYHLDPLWAHPAIDFIGIDNYMPLSDWRDGSGHADASEGSIYNLEYLTRNVAGGEGYDWYYRDTAGRDAQLRSPIVDGAYGEPWVFRYKDLVNWWSRPHFNRPGGTKALTSTEWVPQSKPIWFTELGCPAVDKGTNQPNVFHDPKSSESFFPYYSRGTRDDYIQYCYLQAFFRHWNAPQNNPISQIYGGRMVDMSHAHVWAWDARPWPDFPDRENVWSDGPNYERGHWLNGRASLCALAEVVGEICRRSDVAALDVTTLHGMLTGYTIDAIETARQSLQPLLLTYGFDSFGRDDKLAFSSRSGRVVGDIAPSGVVASGNDPAISLTRGPATETAGRVTFGFVRADQDYQSGVAEALYPGDAETSTSQTSVPVVLEESEARAVAERWLSEGRIAQDMVSFALPPSALAITAGDVVCLRTGSDESLYRIDRVEEVGKRALSGVRIEAGIYEVSVERRSVVRLRSQSAPTPVYAEFLDLPLLSGEERPHAPHIAVAKTPWAGTVAVFSASGDNGYTLNTEVRRPAVLGETLDPLVAGKPGLWMRAEFRVRIASGTLQSASPADVLNGANVAALRFGGVGDWEVVQFASAELVAPRVYRISLLLRGQAGTDGTMPAVWPIGTDFVLIDTAVVQLDLPLSARGVERHYRIGPASRTYDDASYIHQIHAFSGIGLRPYAPAHLRASRRADGAIEISWVRRTRIEGDGWQGVDVPLGEEREAYILRVMNGGQLLRGFAPSVPRQLYLPSEQTADGAPARLSFEVAQVSDRFGPGPYCRIEFDG